MSSTAGFSPDSLDSKIFSAASFNSAGLDPAALGPASELCVSTSFGSAVVCNPKQLLEVGEFVLLARVVGSSCAWFWCGRRRPGQVAAEQFRLSLAGVRELRRRMDSGGQQVFVHVPDPKQASPLRRLEQLLRGDFRFLAHQGLCGDFDGQLIGMDFNDDCVMSPMALRLLERSKCFFKRELPIDLERLLPRRATASQRRLIADHQHKLRPISLGLCRDRQNDLPTVAPAKTCDVFFSGGMTSTLRRKEFPLLEELRRSGVRVNVPDRRLSRAEFLRRCSQSYLVWSPEGCGWDCFRHYEAAAAGSVPVINLPWIRCFAPLQHGQHALYYSSQVQPTDHEPDRGLVPTVLQALKHPEHLIAMGQQAKSHVLRFHTHEAIVGHILQSSEMR